jgi:low affinity Fe/Cu permease
MVFWAGILVAALFARLAIKMGFYETWAMLFNIAVSVYLGVSLRPILIELVPSAGNTPYGSALTIFGIAIGAFLILHGISFVFFTGQFSVSLPKVLNIIGAGLLGFVAGFLVWGFVSFLVSTTPIFESAYMKQLDLGSQIRQTSVPVVCWWCSFVNKIVSSKANGDTIKQELNGLIKNTEKKKRSVITEPNDTDETNEPNTLPEPNNEPNKVKTPAPEKKQRTIRRNIDTDNM